MDKNLDPVKSILEICRDKGYMTAILVTSTIVHATPAAYYSKSKSRYEYDQIAVELSKSNINLFVGGGERYFNDREDNRNLMEEMKSYVFVNNLEEYKNTNDEVGTTSIKEGAWQRLLAYGFIHNADKEKYGLSLIHISEPTRH